MASDLLLTAVVLAGGRGTRIFDIFPDIPKPLVPAAGEPFLHWIVNWLARQGAAQVVLSIGHMAQSIEDWARARPAQPGCALVCRREAQALGTGGGVRNCLDLCEDHVLICNGDSLVAADLSPHFSAMASDGLDGIVFGVEVADASRYGSLRVSPEGLLAEFAEKRPGQGLVNAGIYLLKRCVLEYFAPGVVLSMETDIFPVLLEQGRRIRVVSLGECDFLDIGTPGSVHQASDFVMRNMSLLPG